MLGYALCADAFLRIASANFNSSLRNLVVHQNQREGVVRCALGTVHVLVTAFCILHAWMARMNSTFTARNVENYPVERIYRSNYTL